MAEDWLADVRKYVADADEKVVAAIVRYCGIALQKRDSSLVSFSDSKETDRVRENFLKKKLGLTHDDATLDTAITAVGERMKGDRTKNRVTVYYLLAEHFGLFDIFGGTAGTASAAAAGVGGAAAVAGAALAGDKEEDKAAPASAAPLAAAGLAGAGAAAATPAPAPSPQPATNTTPAAAYSAPQDDDRGGGGMGWLPWLLLALLVAALLFFGLRYCSKQDAAPVAAGPDVAATGPATPGSTAPDATAPAPDTAAAIPAGAGVVGVERDGKPMLSVYFDTGKSEVSNDLSTAASGVKAYLAAHPGATLAVSGFNDPTGNAALNAELSKKRAQAVAKAIEGLGIPAASIKLEKPADTTGTGTDNAGSRRVEVVVKE